MYEFCIILECMYKYYCMLNYKLNNVIVYVCVVLNILLQKLLPSFCIRKNARILACFENVMKSV